MLDICLSESTGAGDIGGGDFNILKREFGRFDCPAIEAGDLCQRYYQRYLICRDKQSAGREVDYNVCKGLSSLGQTACEAAGCSWWNSPSAYPCMLDICLSESTGDGNISGGDFNILKREFGRYNCAVWEE
jgi:hypothetical protein